MRLRLRPFKGLMAFDGRRILFSISDVKGAKKWCGGVDIK